MRVRNLETGERFQVTVPDDALRPGQLVTLQQSEWGKASVQMEIVAERHNGRTRKARLLSVEVDPVGQS